MSQWLGRGVLLFLAALLAPPGFAREPARWTSAHVESVALAALPQEARHTLDLIKRGGPFPYRKDGSVFQNRERRLPPQSGGYYREYTVRTPGESDRGARRIIAGRGPAGDVRTSGEYYYTADHYRSFRRIQE